MLFTPGVPNPPADTSAIPLGHATVPLPTPSAGRSTVLYCVTKVLGTNAPNLAGWATLAGLATVSTPPTAAATAAALNAVLIFIVLFHFFLVVEFASVGPTRAQAEHDSTERTWRPPPRRVSLASDNSWDTERKEARERSR